MDVEGVLSFLVLDPILREDAGSYICSVDSKNFTVQLEVNGGTSTAKFSTA